MQQYSNVPATGEVGAPAAAEVYELQSLVDKSPRKKPASSAAFDHAVHAASLHL